MNYSIKATSNFRNNASVVIKQTDIRFGTTPESSNELANPAELFLSAFAACILKNVERFSQMMKYDYESAKITVNATRFENPPRMDEINYEIIIYSKDEHLNIELLKKNIEKFGTIFNTIKSSCIISGHIKQI